MDKRLKTHPSQWAVFLDFAETNPQILTKKFDGQTARKKYNVLWEEISNTLNSMGYIKKTVEKWQKVSMLVGINNVLKFKYLGQRFLKLVSRNLGVP